MRTRVDLLPVTLKQLSVSAFHRVWIKLGLGVQARARRSAEGFDVRIRYGKDDNIQKSSVAVQDRVFGAVKQLRPALVCAGCGKPASKNLYLGGDFTFRCAKCLGVPQWKIRTPMTWDLGEEVRFRRLLRRKVDQDILRFEMAALRTLTPIDFFASRPYLLPEWVDHLKAVDPMVHTKVLKTLHGKYKSVMMRRRVQFLNDKEEEWLMGQLHEVFTKAAIITRKEMKWLKEHKQQLLKTPSNDIPKYQRAATPGSQPGLGSEESRESSLQLSETDSLSAKTNSEVVMSVEAAQVEVESPAQIAKDQEQSEQSLSVLLATEPDK